MTAAKKNPLTSATPENALTPAEIDDRMDAAQDARIATLRADGSIHLTPAWFVWRRDEQRLLLVFGSDRQHLRNLRRDPRISIMVDQDYRGRAQDFRAGAWCITLRGRAELSTDPDLVGEVIRRIMGKALGAAAQDDPATEAYIEQGKAEGRVVVVVTPEHWLTWDFRKVLPPPPELVEVS